MNVDARLLKSFLALSMLLGVVLAGCTAASTGGSTAPASTADTSATASACPVTEPVWVKPPEDAAVQGVPEYGHYFVNEDRSIWAAAWWTGLEEDYLRAGSEGIKVGWFRPAGATLEITGRRLDGAAPPLEAEVPCCYPTRFQATGVLFPAEGCWEVVARAADSELSFVVWVKP